MAAFIFIIILSVLVLVHELGHFIFAKKNKVKVLEFGLGYPPRAIKLFTWKGTIFSLNWIPFGGFVQMEGEDGPESSLEKTVSKVKSILQKPEEEAFYLKSKKARLEIILAGVVFNFIFAILAFAFVFSKTGIPKTLDNQARIFEVMPGSPAEASQIEPNSNIVAFETADNHWVEMNSISQVQEFVSAHQGETVVIKTVGPCLEDACGEKLSEAEIYLRSDEEIPEGEGSMGVSFTETYFKKYPWYLAPIQGVIHGFKEAIFLALMILQILGTLLLDLMMGKGVEAEVAGPVGIVHQASSFGFFDGGVLNIISFAALLSINLGIMNLLPFPALDGGRAVFVLMEKIFPKKKVDKFAQYANYFGFIFLIALMLLVSINDVRKIFQGF